jgi:predicted O-methyltransferase YrrM
MNDKLQSILCEIERFGVDNDARVGDHRDKMLNITPETGELLAILVQGMNARHVLEIGTSNGYSTLWLADAVQAISGSVVTVELSQAKAAIARSNIERAGLTPWIRQEVMEAGQFLHQQPHDRFDLVFLDSDRKQYSAWWESIQSIVAPGGLLVVDNAVSHAAEMEVFVAQVRDTPGWRSVVVPIGKGELVSLKSKMPF